LDLRKAAKGSVEERESEGGKKKERKENYPFRVKSGAAGRRALYLLSGAIPSRKRDRKRKRERKKDSSVRKISSSKKKRDQERIALIRGRKKGGPLLSRREEDVFFLCGVSKV